MQRANSTNRFLYLAVIYLVILGAAAVAAPRVAPYRPTEQNLDQRYQPPSGAHLLGTDNFGRDILSRFKLDMNVRNGLVYDMNQLAPKKKARPRKSDALPNLPPSPPRCCRPPRRGRS